jgi:hypothetical protein
MNEPDQLTGVWLGEFLNKGVCGLCGNSGKIITFVNSPKGEPCGGVFPCICPNGRKLKGLEDKWLGVKPEQCKDFVDRCQQDPQGVIRDLVTQTARQAATIHEQGVLIQELEAKLRPLLKSE